jgi:hypothetical protein
MKAYMHLERNAVPAAVVGASRPHHPRDRPQHARATRVAYAHPRSCSTVSSTFLQAAVRGSISS